MAVRIIAVLGQESVIDYMCSPSRGFGVGHPLKIPSSLANDNVKDYPQ